MPLTDSVNKLERQQQQLLEDYSEMEKELKRQELLVKELDELLELKIKILERKSSDEKSPADLSKCEKEIDLIKEARNNAMTTVENINRALTTATLKITRDSGILKDTNQRIVRIIDRLKSLNGQ